MWLKSKKMGLVLCTDTLPGIGSLPDVQARAGRVVSSKSISSNHRIISDFDLYTCSQKNKDADFDLASIHGSRLHHKSTFKIDGSIDVHGHRIRSTDHQIGSRCLRTCLWSMDHLMDVCGHCFRSTDHHRDVYGHRSRSTDQLHWMSTDIASDLRIIITMSTVTFADLRINFIGCLRTSLQIYGSSSRCLRTSSHILVSGS